MLTAAVNASMFGSGRSVIAADVARRRRWFSSETGKPFHTVVASKMPSPRSTLRSNTETCGCSGSTSSITSFGSNGVPFGANSAAELPIPNTIPVMMLPFANLHMDIA